jgi:predicted GIY-YIG superfamily endonuclease
MAKGTIYLLHFHGKLSHAHHYIGFTTDLEARLKDHKNGNGARLVEAFTEQGIEFTVARTWSGDRHEERRLKNMKMAPRLCPICKSKRRKG